MVGLSLIMVSVRVCYFHSVPSGRCGVQILGVYVVVVSVWVVSCPCWYCDVVMVGSACVKLWLHLVSLCVVMCFSIRLLEWHGLFAPVISPILLWVAPVR